MHFGKDNDMKNKSLRPNSDRCGLLCIATIMLSVVMFIGAFVGFDTLLNYRLIFLSIGFVLFVLGIICIIYSVLSWNSPLSFDDEKIEQIRFGKKLYFYYDDIENIKYKTINPSTTCIPIVVLKFKSTKDKLKIEIYSNCYSILKEKTRHLPVAKKFR